MNEITNNLPVTVDELERVLLFASLSEDVLGEERGTDGTAEDFEGSSVGFCVSFELGGRMVGFSDNSLITCEGELVGFSDSSSINCEGNLLGLSDDSRITCEGELVGFSDDSSITCEGELVGFSDDSSIV